MRAPSSGVRGRVELLPRLERGQRLVGFDVVPELNGPRAFEKPLVRDEELVAEPELGSRLAAVEVEDLAARRDSVARRFARLAIEGIDDGGDGVERELLVRVELEFHRIDATNRTCKSCLQVRFWGIASSRAPRNHSP